MKVEFAKNVYTPSEEAEGEISIDNTECKLDVTSVKFAIVQVVK